MSIDDPSMPPIEFTPAGETIELREANLGLVEPSPGFIPAANLCVDIIVRDAEITVLDFTPQQVNVRFKIDGLWHAGPQFERESGDYMLATIKQMAGLNFRERRLRQKGSFKSVYMKRGQKFTIESQGVPSGERVAIYLDYKRPPLETAQQMGMRAKMQEQVSAVIANEKMGNLLVVGYPGEGFTTSWQGFLGCADRLTRDFFVLQPKGRGEDEEIINIFPTEYDPTQGEDAMTPVPQLLLKQPDLLAFPDLDSGDLIDRIIELSVNKSMPIFTRNPGKHCVDGLLRVIAKRPDVKRFMDRLDAVGCMRVIRKLCDTCKVSFTPHPQLLQQLGLPAGRVAVLHQPFIYKPGMLDEDERPIEPCANCCGIGFKGRTGIFEFLTINQAIRDAVIQNPKMAHLQAVTKQQGHVSMQMEGILLIAKGVTSVDELQRVMKG